MADITMCAEHSLGDSRGSSCPVRHLCYRSTATPSPYRQSYFGEPYKVEERTCDYFWFNGKLPELKKLKDVVSEELLDQMRT